MPITYVFNVHQEICERCSAHKYYCYHCHRWVCPKCPPVPINDPWGFGCPHCGTYWSVYYDPPENMSREEWEKEFQKRSPENYEIYERSRPSRGELIQELIARFGEFKKVIRLSTGVAYKVPTRDICQKGIREQDLDRYPLWEE